MAQAVEQDFQGHKRGVLMQFFSNLNHLLNEKVTKYVLN